MSEKARVESVSVYRNWWWIIVAFGIGVIALGLRVRAAAFSAPYLQLDNLAFMLLFTGIGTWCLTLPLRLRKYLLFNDRLEIRRATGRLLQTVYLKSITGWSEEHIRLSKSPDEWILRVFHSDGSVKLSSARIRNWSSFHALKRGRRHETPSTDLQGAWYLCGGMLLVGLLLLIPGSGVFVKDAPPELLRLPAALAQDPQIYRSGRSGNVLRLKLRGLEAFTVSISGSFYRETAANDFMDDVHEGDSVFLLLQADEYRAKILKLEEAPFAVKHFSYWRLSPYGLSTRDAKYLDEDAAWAAYSDQRLDNARWCMGAAIVFGGLGICLLVLTIRKRRELAAGAQRASAQVKTT